MRFNHHAPATLVHCKQGSGGNGVFPCFGGWVGGWTSRGRPMMTWYPHSPWTMSIINIGFRLGCTDGIIDCGNYANGEKDTIEKWSATGNGAEEVADDKRCVDNCEDRRTTFRAQSLTCIDNQRNCRSYWIRNNVKEVGKYQAQCNRW